MLTAAIIILSVLLSINLFFTVWLMLRFSKLHDDNLLLEQAHLDMQAKFEKLVDTWVQHSQVQRDLAVQATKPGKKLDRYFW